MQHVDVELGVLRGHESVMTTKSRVQSNLVRTNTDKASFPLVRTRANPMVGQASIQVKIIRLR